MLSAEDVARRARASYDRHWRDWFADVVSQLLFDRAFEQPSLVVSLKPPSEKEALDRAASVRA